MKSKIAIGIVSCLIIILLIFGVSKLVNREHSQKETKSPDVNTQIGSETDKEDTDTDTNTETGIGKDVEEGKVEVWIEPAIEEENKPTTGEDKTLVDKEPEWIQGDY